MKNSNLEIVGSDYRLATDKWNEGWETKQLNLNLTAPPPPRGGDDVAHNLAHIYHSVCGYRLCTSSVTHGCRPVRHCLLRYPLLQWVPDLTATAAICRNSGNTVVEVVATTLDPNLGVPVVTTRTVYAPLLLVSPISD